MELDGEIVARRFRLLRDEWQSLGETMSFDPDRLRLNPDILMEVVGSFFRQLQQYKGNETIRWADGHKSGGFMMYWICQLKPVQVLAASDGEAEALEEVEMLANELFAIHTGISCLDCTPDLIGDFSFFSSLVKRLRERQCPPEYLSGMLFLYEQLRQARV